MTLDFTGMFEKVASKRSVADRYVRMYERMARTSPGRNASNYTHWAKRVDKWHDLMENKVRNLPYNDYANYINEARSRDHSIKVYKSVMRGYNNNKVMPMKELKEAKEFSKELHKEQMRLNSFK